MSGWSVYWLENIRLAAKLINEEKQTEQYVNSEIHLVLNDINDHY